VLLQVLAASFAEAADKAQAGKQENIQKDGTESPASKPSVQTDVVPGQGSQEYAREPGNNILPWTRRCESLGVADKER